MREKKEYKNVKCGTCHKYFRVEMWEEYKLCPHCGQYEYGPMRGVWKKCPHCGGSFFERENL